MQSLWLYDIDQYPDPIYLPYLHIQKENQPDRQLRRLIDSFEIFLKFIVFTTLQEISKNPKLIKNISRVTIGQWIEPSLGTWQNCMDFIIKYCNQMESQIFSELLIFYNKVRDMISKLVNFRNRYVHDKLQNIEIIQDYFRQYINIYNSILKNGIFLKSYSLYANEDNHVIIRDINKDASYCCLYPLFLMKNNEYYLFKDAKLYRKRKITYDSIVDLPAFATDETYDDFIKTFPLKESGYFLPSQWHYKVLGNIIGRENDALQIRADIKHMEEKRQLGGTILVVGGPGVGKTSFSFYLAEALKDNYFCIQTFFNGNDKTTLSIENFYDEIHNALLQYRLIKNCPPPEFSPLSVRKSIAEQLQDAIIHAKSAGKNILLLIDGLDEAINNGARDCLDAIPRLLPKGCYGVFFSRPSRDIEIWYQSLPDLGRLVRTLEPLSEDATRQFLEQVIPWPILSQNPTIVKRAYEASRGHPIYLKHLAESLLEGKQDYDLLNLPLGMKARYDQIFSRIIQFPLSMEIAAVLSVSSEPLTLADIAEIFYQEEHISPGQTKIAITYLLEILHEVFTQKKEVAYQLFHISAAEYIQTQYPILIEKAETKILEWQCKDKEKLSSLLKSISTKEKNFDAYRLLIPFISRRLASREILIKKFLSSKDSYPNFQILFEMSKKEKNRVYSQLALDVLRRLADIDPSSFTNKAIYLAKRYPDEIELFKLTIDVLLKTDLEEENKRTLLNIISDRFRNGEKNITFFQLESLIINLIRLENGFGLLLDIVWHILPFSIINREKEQRFYSYMINNIILSSAWNSFVSLIRSIDKATKLIKHDDYIRIKLTKSFFYTTRLFRFWLSNPKFQIKTLVFLIRNIFQVKPFFRSISASSDLIIKAFPLIFTIRDQPALAPDSLEKIQKIESFIRLFAHKLSPYEGEDIISACEKELTKTDGGDVPKNIIYIIIKLLFKKYLKDMFNYSHPGLEAIINYEQKDINRIKKALPLLSPTSSIEMKHEIILNEMLYQADAFNNYLAMLVIIIHNQTEFEKGKRILERMINKNSQDTLKSFRATQRLKLYRQAISIFSYVFRRIENEELAAKVAQFVHQLLSLLKNELRLDREMRKIFTGITIFGQNDPFYPLLPLGIYYSGRLGPENSHELYLNLITEWISFAKEMEILDSELKLYGRVVSELIPLSYFAPDFALEIAIALTNSTFRDTEREALRNVINFIELIAPGRIEKLIKRRMTGQYPGSLNVFELISACRDISSPQYGIKDFFRAIHVFAWHECITTIMIHYPRISNIVINCLNENLQVGMNINQILLELGFRLWKDFVSPEVMRNLCIFLGAEKVYKARIL